MDQRLRILQRQAQFDDDAKERYCQELDRIFSNLPSNEESTSVWIVVHCHEGTAADDVSVFLTNTGAEAYAVNRMINIVRNARNATLELVAGGLVALGVDATAVDEMDEALTLMEQRLRQNNYVAIYRIFEELMANEMWFEIEEKVIRD